MTSGIPHDYEQLVVVGTSAGGVEALSVLVSTLPASFPAPIVVAQHLAPTRESHLGEVLARRSTLPVHTVHGDEPMKAGVVYVVPANKHAEISDGAITLREDTGERPRPSVDRLLSTSATHYGENLIAVILTGSGSDGAAGARAVKKAGGTVVIQDPATASFPGMPASLAPSTVDIIADIERIGPVLNGLLEKSHLPAHDQDGLQALLEEVKERSGIDFRKYPPATIQWRLQRRMADTGTTDFAEYLRYYRGHAEEHQRLINGFIVQVTEFMRDPDLFVYLRDKILPEITARARKRGNELRIWAAGSGTGEEAYSIAILVNEALGSAIEHFAVRIFATDLDSDAIEFARRGVYPAAALGDLPTKLRERYFTEVDGSYQVNKLIRGLTVFGAHDLAQRAPFPRIQMLLCRGVLDHFTSQHQARTLQLFAYAMENGSYLVLDKNASTSPPEKLFMVTEPDLKIYQRRGEQVSITTPRPSLSSRGSALAAAEQGSPRARALAESFAADLQVGLVILRPRYDILEINPAARRALGIHGPAIGEDLVHLVHGAEGRRLRGALDAALRGEVPPPLEDFPVQAAGADAPRYVTILCRPQLRRDEDREAPGESPPRREEVAGVVMVVQDTTSAVEELRRLEAASARGAAVEQELRATVSQLETQAASLQADRARLEVSLRELAAELEEVKAQRSHDSERLARQIEQIRELGSANEELAARADRLRHTHDEFVLSSEAALASTQEAETLNEEFQATNEELETLNEEFQATIEELNTTNEDLEARGRELAELARVADAERERLSAVLVSIGDGVLVVDAEGRVILTNEAFRRMFEAPPETILGEGGAPVPPDQLPHRRAARGESFRMEFSLPIKDAGPKDYEAIGQPVHTHDHGLEGGVVVIRDISERSMPRLQDRFLAMASHELRTPLVPLQGYLQLLTRSLSKSEGEADGARMRYANNAILQVRRVTDLVNELVDATRFQTGKFQLNCAPLDLAALIAQIVRSAQDMTAGQTITLEIEPGPMMVDGDAARIEQVVINLLTNATKYAPDADRIEVRLRRVGDEAALEIEDHGPGIAESDLPKLFWPFYQVADVQHPSRGGLGLGLFICREIVTSHGGQITVRSTPGKGTTFTVRLRLRDASEPEPKAT